MPISLNLMIAILTALRILCFVAATLFLALAIKGQYDETVTLGWWGASGLSLAFFVGAAVCGLARKALEARIKS